MEHTPGMENRRQKRVAIDSLALPFLATRESDQQTFQYLLIDSSEGGAGIAIPQWAMARERLNAGERVNLHMPFRVHEKNLDRGEVAWANWRPDDAAQHIGVRLDKETPVYYPLHIDLEAGEVSLDLQGFVGSNELMLQVLKDSCLLKRGVMIYLGHLEPYFSRVSRLSREDFELLRGTLLGDVEGKVADHHRRLQDILDQMTLAADQGKDLAVMLDLEGLRLQVQSELYLDLFAQALESDLALQYLRAIKVLEGRLYYNYNTMVMLYMKALTAV